MSSGFPYALERVGVVMTPAPGDPVEAEGVLNPGSALAADGRLFLLPRVVATGNVSRIALARLRIEQDVPVGVERRGVVLEPEREWERGGGNAGVEDPRVTWVPSLLRFVMTYVGYGAAGPRAAVAVAQGLRNWRRLGPVSYERDGPDRVDLGAYGNKDTVFFPDPVLSPAGVWSLAVLHRPMWEPGLPPASLTETRESIWIAFVPLAAVHADLGALTHWVENRFLAGPAYPFEEVKIGGGPPPLRVPEGWLVLHHGVRRVPYGRGLAYAAGAMILDADRPWQVVARTAEPLLTADTADERDGTVADVVFPTAIETIGGQSYVFYGMADSKIGVARLVPSR